MKRVLLICLSALLLAACGNSGQNGSQTAAVEATIDSSTVCVYYFYGKQRCLTCNTVEKVTKEFVEENYASNPKVVFKVLSVADKANAALVEKYEISWNGLVIAKGDDAVNITQQAFANAVKTPYVLAGLIQTEVDKRLN